MTIVVTMCKLLFAMAMGFILHKKNMLDVETNKRLSAVIVNVTCPFLIVSSVGSVDNGSRGDIILLLIAGAVTYCLLPVISKVIVTLLGVPKDRMGTYQCMIMFANCTFMGYPVVEALFGSYAVFYTTIFHMGFNFLFFIYGRFIIDRDAGEASSFEPKRLINSGVIAGVVSLAIYFSGMKLPEIISSPLSFVGGVTTPLSMIVIGSNMAGYAWKEIFSEKKIYIITLVRLFVMPILAFAGMSMITKDKILISIVTMTLGMPVASLVAMGSSKYEKQGKVASISVVISTLCSMITIPILAIILEKIL